MATLVSLGTSSRTPIDISTAALAAATSGGDAFVNTGYEYLVVNNGDASPHTVQFLYAPGVLIDGVAPTAPTHSVAAGKTVVIGGFPPGTFNDGSGLVQVRYDAVTSVKVGYYRAPPAGPGQ